MKITLRAAIPALAAAGLLAAGACQTPVADTATSPGEVTFTVTGTGQPSVIWGTDSAQHTDNDHTGAYGMGYADLPYRHTVALDRDALYYYVNAQLGTDGGAIDCTVTIDGDVVARGDASGPAAICTAQANADPFGNGFE